MRKPYVPVSDEAWLSYYQNQTKQRGSGFVGTAYQRGAGVGSIFSGLFRALLPLAKSAGKAIGKQALRSGAEIASDVLAGQSLKQSTKRRSKAAAGKLLAQAQKRIQGGRGLGIKGTKSRSRTISRKTTRKKKVTDQLGAYYK